MWERGCVGERVCRRGCVVWERGCVVWERGCGSGEGWKEGCGRG